MEEGVFWANRCCCTENAIRARNLCVSPINASEMNFPNAVCRGLLRLHTDVLAVGGCAGESSSARHPALSFSPRVIYAPLVH